MSSSYEVPGSSAVPSPRHSTNRGAQRAAPADCPPIDRGSLGMLLVAGGAFTVTSWLVGVNAGSSGEGQAATVQNLTITAVAVPSATNQLYPGGTGDVVLTIPNPNAYPVTLTGVNLPVNTSFAGGSRPWR